MPAQTIDGFIRRSAAPTIPPAIPRAQPARQPAAARPRPVPPVTAEAPASQPAHRPAAPRQTTPPRLQLRERLQLPLIITGAVLAGWLVQSLVIGQAFIVAYGIAAVAWRIHSRHTFTIALMAMATTALMVVVQGNGALAHNFATYSFLLLVVGVITLSRELKREGGRVYNTRKNTTSNY